ncbi:MAG: hypothetical protein D6709_04110 [Chloroflexi bacterium]|jgi:hypothetical protein|uniref:DUF11 domain-containing protein n=1 Tax=Candidatus Thermofonsia Clade 3 bacterium TaxID=2364212 RepID=A0A2M8QER0_9CHLR|nr:hypothetical protein [Candidatus Roseilinea sp. NK_OTU-006]PJF48248.1 MAG: hypothetical protein CUN48_04650 [Candidatus Thermofonsia Clade 3 bacterium]RMG65002.1 MAG: hypothetical protein D6709_04110 [Chloroflexota bacterium]
MIRRLVPLFALVFVFVLAWTVLSSDPAPLGPLNSPLVMPVKYVTDPDETLVMTDTAQSGSVVTYTLVLSGTHQDVSVVVTDVVGSNGTVLAGTSASTSGSPPVIAGNVVTWTGVVSANAMVTLSFQVQLTRTVATTALINFFYGNNLTGASNVVTTTIEPYRAHLPLVRRQTSHKVYFPLIRTL